MENFVLSTFLATAGALLVNKILPTAILIIVCLIVVKYLLKFSDKLFIRMKVPATLLGMLRAIMKVLLLFLVVLIVMGFLGIPVTSLVAVLSVVGVAISLGIQNFLSNVVGGFQLIGSHPFDVGDYVEAGGCSGTVREIGLFYTKIMTVDNKMIQMPNSAVVSANIVNYSAEETRRVDLTFTTSYDASVETVKKAILDVIGAHSLVQFSPEPFVRVSNYGDSAIEYTVRVWCATDDYWTVYFDLMEQVKTAFDNANIEMTYPHLNVHMMKD